jgi:hypothetical protein
VIPRLGKVDVGMAGVFAANEAVSCAVAACANARVSIRGGHAWNGVRCKSVNRVVDLARPMHRLWTIGSIRLRVKSRKRNAISVQQGSFKFI